MGRLVQNAHVGDVAFLGQALQDLVEARPVAGANAVLGQVGEHLRDRVALHTQLPLAVLPLPPEQEGGDRDRGEEDQSDGEQVELGEQAHTHRGQVERRGGVAAERREVSAQPGPQTDHAVSGPRPTSACRT